MVWPEAGEGRAVRATFGLLGPGGAIVPSFRSEREVVIFSLHRLELDSIRLSAKSFCWISNLARRTHPNWSREEWLACCHIYHRPQLHLLEHLPSRNISWVLPSKQLLTFSTSSQTGYCAPPEPPKSSVPNSIWLLPVSGAHLKVELSGYGL